MDPKDIRNLVESYQNVYAEQEVSEDMYSAVKAGLEKGSKALENSPAGGVLKMLVGPVGGNKGKRTPSAADQKKKIAANESVSEPKRTVKMSATGREPIGDKVIRTIGDKLKKTFGGKGTDKSANESVELYNIVFNHLIEEGFASSEENAEKIISVMSDEWISSIVEQDATSSMADRAKRAVANQRSGFHGDDDALTRTQRATQRSIDKLKGSAASMAKEV
jgi:hypothetical protein